jgi:hypothetical protein
MISKISTRDWETLSAYLDDQLSPEEHSQLAARLEDSQELRQSLEQLRRTRAALRSVPKLRAPRNFTLTLEMAGVHPDKRTGTRPLPEIFPVLRLASVLATFFFLVIFVGSVIGRNVLPQSVSMAPAQQQPIRPPLGMGGGGGGGGEPEPELEAPMEGIAPQGEAAPQEREASKAYEASPVADSLQAQAVTPLPTSTSTIESLPTQALEQPAAPGLSKNVEVGPQFGATPVEEAQAPPSVGAGSWSILLIVQILLAIIAIGTGIGALYLRRSAQK